MQEVRGSHLVAAHRHPQTGQHIIAPDLCDIVQHEGFSFLLLQLQLQSQIYIFFVCCVYIGSGICQSDDGIQGPTNANSSMQFELKLVNARPGAALERHILFF